MKKYRGGGGGVRWAGAFGNVVEWLIKNTWPTPLLRHKNERPTPKARLEIA